jgi:hypothetical protein
MTSDGDDREEQTVERDEHSSKGMARKTPTKFEDLDPFELGRLAGVYLIEAEDRGELLGRLRNLLGEHEPVAVAYARGYTLRYRLGLLFRFGLVVSLVLIAGLFGIPIGAASLLLGGQVLVWMPMAPMTLVRSLGFVRSRDVLRASGVLCSLSGLVLLTIWIQGQLPLA